MLVEVECMLNVRPMTYKYNEVDDEVLTPSHLIYGRRIKSLLDKIMEPDDVVSEVQCPERCKARSKNRTVEVGDIVLVLEEEK